MSRERVKLFCVIGDPVYHSLSPIMHNSAFRKLRLNCLYFPFRVREGEIAEFFEFFRDMDMKGANVTIPHKETVLEFLDELDEPARKIGAVNTIVKRQGKLVGYNTDCYGALKAVGKGRIAGKNIVVFGAGGAARAIAFAFATLAKKIILFNRTGQRARKIADDLEYRNIEGFGMEDMDLVYKTAREADVIINATSVGMNAQDSIVPTNILRRGMVVFDAVYTPLETKLIREAKKAGCDVVTGDRMLLHQGAEAFRLFTGKKPPIETMRKRLLEALGVDMHGR
ncbi:MAG: shikimate dehydrogenase [Candidatus Micrarchaeia archaeon]